MPRSKKVIKHRSGEGIFVLPGGQTLNTKKATQATMKAWAKQYPHCFEEVTLELETPAETPAEEKKPSRSRRKKDE